MQHQAQQQGSPPPEVKHGSFDTDQIAQLFPLIASGRERKRPLVYLDNASTTQKPQCVLTAQDYFYLNLNANPHRASYSLSKEATRLYENARYAVSRFIGCAEDEVVFTSGATESLNTIAYAYGMTILKTGDEIVLPISEHHSNLVPWQTVANVTGARLVYAFIDGSGQVTEQEWQRVISPRTKIVAVAHVSNVLGSVAPLKTIARLAHEVGAIVVADCAQSVPHLALDMHALDLDFAAFSGHKMYAPMGIGVLYGKRELLETMPPFMRGGGMVDSVFERRTDFLDAPFMHEAGTPNVAGAAGLAEAIQLIGSLGFDAIHRHEHHLLQRLLAGLNSIPGISVYGDTRVDQDKAQEYEGYSENVSEITRCGVVSFNIDGTSAMDVAEVLAREGIAVRAGALCAEPLVRHLEQRAVCRASIALYNTEHEIDRFLEVLEHARRSVGLMVLASMH